MWKAFCWAMRSQRSTRAALGELLVQFNSIWQEGLVVQPGEGHRSSPAGLPFDFSKKKKKGGFL